MAISPDIGMPSAGVADKIYYVGMIHIPAGPRVCLNRTLCLSPGGKRDSHIHDSSEPLRSIKQAFSNVLYARVYGRLAFDPHSLLLTQPHIDVYLSHVVTQARSPVVTTNCCLTSLSTLAITIYSRVALVLSKH